MGVTPLGFCPIYKFLKGTLDVISNDCQFITSLFLKPEELEIVGFLSWEVLISVNFPNVHFYRETKISNYPY